MRAKLFDMIRACQMSVSMPDIHIHVGMSTQMSVCVCVCASMHMCHALAHARNSHTVTEQKVNSKTESTADADSKSKPQQHDAVTFFRLPTKSKESHARDWAKWKCERERTSWRNEENWHFKSQPTSTLTSTTPPHVHISSVCCCSRVSLLFLRSFSLSGFGSPWRVATPTCVLQNADTNNNTRVPLRLLYVCARESVRVCVCVLIVVVNADRALVGLLWLFLVCSRQACRATV